MGEPPFPKTLPHEGVAMRLLIMPSFAPPYVIRVQNFPFARRIYSVLLEDQTGPTGVMQRNESRLTDEQWDKLASRFEQIGFWDLATPNPAPGIDGSMWVLEVVTQEQYHLVERWSGGELEPVGSLLQKWSTFPIDKLHTAANNGMELTGQTGAALAKRRARTAPFWPAAHPGR